MTIQQQLKTIRLQAGLTQKALAEKLGVTKSYISNTENGGEISRPQAGIWASACGYELFENIEFRPKKT